MIGLSIPIAKLIANREVLEPALRIAMEIDRRNKHPYYSWVPDDHPERNQLAFHQSKAHTRLAFGGNQSGKSRTVSQEIDWWLNGEHPWQDIPKGCRIYVVSASYRTIQEGVWRHLRETLPDWQVKEWGPTVPPWNISAYVEVNAVDGTVHRVDFLSGEGREDARKKAAAAAIDLVVVDEEIDVLLWEELQARMLSRGGRAVVSATLHRSEPWCLDLQHEAETGSPDVDLFRFSTYRARDAGHVDAKQVARIEATFAPEEVDVRLKGLSRQNQGLIYPEFGKHNICPQFDPPTSWTRYCVLDPGHGQSAFAILWAAVSPDNRVWLYREHYWHTRNWFDVAKDLMEAEGWKSVELPKEAWRQIGSVVISNRWVRTEKTEKIRLRLCDPSSFGTETSGEPKTAGFLAQLGIKCGPAMNDVESGIQLVRNAMLPGIGGAPQLMVCGHLKHWLSEVRDYRRRKDTSGPNAHAMKSVPRKKNDHLMDCTKYLFQTDLRYVEPQREPDFEPPVPYSVGLDQRVRDDWNRTLKRQKDGGYEKLEHACLGSEY